MCMCVGMRVRYKFLLHNTLDNFDKGLFNSHLALLQTIPNRGCDEYVCKMYVYMWTGFPLHLANLNDL